MNLKEELFKYEDKSYKEFNAKLNPKVDKNTIIGIRLPILRTIAKEYYKHDESKQFIEILPHELFEENFIHALLLEQVKDIDVLLMELNKFLPYVDNWAICDSMNPKILKKCSEKEIEQIYLWLKSKDVYTIRFGVNCLMRHYLSDSNFKVSHIEKLTKIRNEDYYVKMVVAWYLATALAKQWDATIPFMVNKCFEKWIHNKAIQKAVESYRITSEQKEYLKTLKIKG